VTYAVLTGPATIAGNLVTVTGSGTVVLSASQAASGGYAAAVATTSFTVGLPFTLATTAGSASGESVSPGSAASFTLMLSPAVGTAFPDPIKLSVTGLSTGATASFSPASTIAAGSGTTTVMLTIQTTNTQTARNQQPTHGNPLAPVALGFLILPLLGMKAAQKRLRQMPRLGAVLLAAGLSLGAVLGISCCAGSQPPSGSSTAEAQTYTLAVAATDTTTNAQSTMSIALTIQ
jgi:hypothetical protein